MEHEDFVTFEQAVKLKEIEFDWKCREYYYNLTQRIIYTYGSNCFDFDNMTKAPTLAQAQKWLREFKKINVEVIACFSRSLDMWQWDCFIQSLEDDEVDENTINHDTYEKALSAGIDKALELLVLKIKS